MAVAVDIMNAILKKHSVKGLGAEYWDKSEQEQQLEAAFAKWAKKGTVWSAAAMQVSSHCFLPHLVYHDTALTHMVIRYIKSSLIMFERAASNATIRIFHPMAVASKVLTRAGTHSNESSQVGSLY